MRKLKTNAQKNIKSVESESIYSKLVKNFYCLLS